MKHFQLSFIVAIVCLSVAFYWGFSKGGMTAATTSVMIALILGVLEVSLSFDNAVVNASILKRMDDKWQQYFLTWGILVAVFGMRLLFPIAIVVFAYLSSTMRNRIIKRRAAKGKTGESPKFEKAVRMFDKYGIYGMAIAAPALIGTQIAAMASVAAGVKPFRALTLIIASTLLWSAGIAIAMIAFDIRLTL